MRKIFIIAAVLFIGCTSEQTFSVEPQANVWTFDVTEEQARDLYVSAEDIVRVHIDFENFQFILPKDLLTRVKGRLQNNLENDIDDLVECIYIWRTNDDTFDVMCEWPEWDTFYELLKNTKYEQKFYDL